MQQINFYRQRVAINVLAKDIANAKTIYEAAEGHAVIGVLSAQFLYGRRGRAGGETLDGGGAVYLGGIGRWRRPAAGKHILTRWLARRERLERC